MWRLQTMILLGGLTVAGQVKVDLGNQARNYDFSGAPFTRTVKTGTTLPAECNPGDLFYNTAAAAGTNLYGCTTLNVWSQETGVGASVTFTSSDGSITRAVAGANVDLAVDPTVVATATGNVDLSGANNVGLGATGFLSLTVPNEGTTGTTLNRLAIFTGAPSSLAVVAGAASATGVIGVVLSGAGTTGNARIAFRGFAACDFDGATTAGDYVQTSTATGGQCHDAAATRPAN